MSSVAASAPPSPVERGIPGMGPAWVPRAALLLGWIVVAGGVLVVLSGDPDSVAWYFGAGVLLVGAHAVRRLRPRASLGSWFALLAAFLLAGFLSLDLLDRGVRRDLSDGWLVALILGSQLVTAAAAICAVRLIALFPDGEYLDRVDRGVLRVTWLALVVPPLSVLFAPRFPLPSFISDATVTNPMALPGHALSTDGVAALQQLPNLLTVVAAVLLVRRYRRVDLGRRRPIRWLLLPVIAGVVLAAVTVLAQLPDAAAGLASLVVVVALGGAVTLGLVRPSGIDVDDALRRTVVYGALVLIVAALYAAVAAIIGWTVGGGISVGWAVGVTVVVMIGLQPARAALERSARRWLFGSPVDSRVALMQLGERLADTYDVETLLDEIATALEDGLGVSWARVRLQDHGGEDGPAPVLSVPIKLDGDVLGAIECGPTRTGALEDEDAAVVASLAAQAALAIRNTRLKAIVEDRNVALTASRERLVRAQDEERRRIERNIHDGVQQDIVALIGVAGLLQRRLHEASDPGAEVVDRAEELGTGLRRVLDDVRELSAGIHPHLLRDRGLVVAIERLASRHPVPAAVEVTPGLRASRLPAAVEGAAYFVVAESLANSLKHADASAVSIRLVRSDSRLSISVADDGAGFEPAPTLGNGLANLTERIAALGGRLQVDSAPGRGTAVTAELSVDGVEATA